MNEPRKPRPGSARWRQQRRKERQLEQEMAPKRTTERRQVASGGFKMPDVKLPWRSISIGVYALLAVGLVAGIIFALRLVNPPEDVTTYPNGIWLGTEWSYNQPTDDEVAQLVQRLRDNRIGTAYVWVSYLTENFTWSGKTADRDPVTGEIVSTVNPDTGEPYRNELSEMEPNVIRFVEQYQAAYPEGRLYGWISYPTNLDSDGYTLDDTTLHTRIAELATVLVTVYGFDGIFLNVEPVQDGDENFLQLLRTVRLTLQDVAEQERIEGGVPLAVVIPPDWRPSDVTVPHGELFTGVVEWRKDYKQSVALLSDEMLVMAYHSGLADAEDYTQWVAYQTQAYARAIAELELDTELLIGIPTYPAELPAHDPRVENVETAVRGVLNAVERLGETASVMRGLTIYAEWTTDEPEWVVFENMWARRNE